MVIRQAVTCDICGTDKKQTNHWFVALDTGGELKLGDWSSPHCQSPGAKHLCGNTCLHKLVDDFMARVLAERAQPGQDDSADRSGQVSAARCGEAEIPARRAALPPAVASAQSPIRLALGQRAAARLRVEDAPSPPERPLRYAQRIWRARALERELRAAGRLTEIAARRRVR